MAPTPARRGGGSQLWSVMRGMNRRPAALDNALNNRAMQRHFVADPVSWAARTYLSTETMSLG